MYEHEEAQEIVDRLFGDGDGVCGEEASTCLGCGCRADSRGDMSARKESTHAADGCRCKPSRFGLSCYPLAMVYAPVQEWKDVYDESHGLKRGTIFKALDLPFEGDGRDGKGGVCR